MPRALEKRRLSEAQLCAWTASPAVSPRARGGLGRRFSGTEPAREGQLSAAAAFFRLRWMNSSRARAPPRSRCAAGSAGSAARSPCLRAPDWGQGGTDAPPPANSAGRVPSRPLPSLPTPGFLSQIGEKDGHGHGRGTRGASRPGSHALAFPLRSALRPSVAPWNVGRIFPPARQRGAWRRLRGPTGGRRVNRVSAGDTASCR